jgi:hypothetical protein
MTFHIATNVLPRRAAELRLKLSADFLRHDAGEGLVLPGMLTPDWLQLNIDTIKHRDAPLISVTLAPSPQVQVLDKHFLARRPLAHSRA